MLRPTSKLLVSTVAGRRPGVFRSWARCLAPRTRLPAAGVDDLLDHGRIRPREVRRCERVEHVAGGEPRPPLGAPVDRGVGDQSVDGLADREVPLEKPAEQPVALPGGVGEATVAFRRRKLRAAGGGAGQLGSEDSSAAYDPPGAQGQADADLDRRARRDEPGRAVCGGFAQQHVQSRLRRPARPPGA